MDDENDDLSSQSQNQSQSQSQSQTWIQRTVGTPSSVASSSRRGAIGGAGSVAGTPSSILSSRGYSQTPMVFGTPRTPVDVSQGSLRRVGTPQQGFLPRSEFGHTSRAQRFAAGTPNSSYAPSSPRTPSSPTHSVNGDVPYDVPYDINDDVVNPGGTLIWGTSIDIASCFNVFREFINNFTLQGFEPHYLRQMSIMHRTQHMIMNLNCAHLEEYTPTKRFYKQLINYPQEVLPILDAVVLEEYIKNHGQPQHMTRICVRTFGLTKYERMRDLEPDHIDSLLCIKGMVIRCSQVIPELKQAFFRCFICQEDAEVLIDRGRIDEPATCPRCRTLGSMEIVHNRCLFSDKQLVRLQETPDEVPEGETPFTVSLFAYDDLVDTVRPGDRVEVTGIFKAHPHRVNPRMRSVRCVYKTHIDSIHFRRCDMQENSMGDIDGEKDDLENGIFGANQGTKQFTPEQIRDFEIFASSGNNIYEKLITAFAPSIWELDDVKRGILCQLFGGTLESARSKDKSLIGGILSSELNDDQYDLFGNESDMLSRENTNKIPEDDTMRMRHRSDIHILLCGDPGTSKSQLLSYVHKMTPRGIYTSGKGSSAVGLTASVVKDPETRETVLESGALVLSDNGICCIDEFDKMEDSTRAMLHEAMEQQSVSITKAGIIATLNARTSILASANPVESRYNSKLSVVENIKLPPTLLSRFDLIYLILDKPNKDNDRRLAQHLVSLYNEVSQRGPSNAPCSQEFLRDYIMYARNNLAPEVTDEAERALIRGYLAMRSLGGRGSKTITATPRQLESLIRIAQALAKMRLSKVVTGYDVDEAIRLMKVATQTAATDPRTGTIDMDMITTGRTAVDREIILNLADELKKVFSARKGQRMSLAQLRSVLAKDGDQQVTLHEVEEAVKEVLDSDNPGIKYIQNTQTVIVQGQ